MNKVNILNFILNKYEKEKHVSKEIILELRQTIKLPKVYLILQMILSL